MTTWVIPASATRAIGLTSRPALLDRSFQTRLYHLRPVGVDSGLRRAATGILGGLFQTPLYHLHPCRRVHK